MDVAGDRPTVSVVVPVRDGADLLDECLAALGQQDYPSHLLQVIVVDNNSVEDVASVVARHDDVLLLRESAPGSYAARNAALDRATGEVLAFTDADCRPQADWVAAAVDALMQATTDESVPTMIGGAVELVYPHGRPVSAGELYEALHGFKQEQYIAEQGFAVTANMVTWRRSFDQVGRFDARLRSGGDAQWGRRLAEAGGIQRYAAAAVVRHPARSSLLEMTLKCHRVATGHARLDLDRGITRREAAHVVHWQLISWWRRARALRSVPQLNTVATRARYLLAYAVYRGMNALAYTHASLRVAGRHPAERAWARE